MPDDYYRILGVNDRCSQDDIKQAYRNLAKLHHPDINKSAKAPETMKRINIAYATLSDPEKRKEYDAYLRGARTRQYSGEPNGMGRHRSGNSQRVKRRYIFNLWMKSAFQTVIIVCFIMLIAGSILYIYLNYTNGIFAHASGQTSNQFLYSTVQPTVMVNVPSGPLNTPTPASATVQATLAPTPNATIVPTPSPTVSTTVNPLSVEEHHIQATPPENGNNMGKGIVIGQVTISGSIMGADGAYVAICDAGDPDLEYYSMTTGLGGYFQFPSVNSTVAINGTLEGQYVIYAWDDSLKRGNFSQPFGVEPYHIQTQNVQI